MTQPVTQRVNRSPDEILDDVRALLERSAAVDAWSRAAAFLARQALEAQVGAMIEAKYGKMDQPTFTSQLIVLRTLVEPDLAREVAWTWAALSSATHAHSYELPATGAELARWVECVERLSRQVSSDGSDSSACVSS